MAAFFRKKRKKDEEQEPTRAADTGGPVPDSTEGEPGRPKAARRPLFGKKKQGAGPAQESGATPPPAEPPVPAPPFEQPGEAAAPPPAGSGEEETGKPAKKGMFGRKKGDGKREKKGKKKDEDKAGAAAVADKPKKKKKKRGSFGGSKYSPVGLDIGRASIAAVRLQHQTSGSILMSAALDQLPDGIINEGEVMDVDALATAIRNFWKTYKIRGKKVSLGLASQKVVVRTLDFPMLDKKELRQAIEYQAQDYIPIPIEEAVFDFHVMGRFTDEDGVEKQKVLVIAAQKVMVMNFIDAIKKARLTIDGIDLQAFAMLRTFSTSSFVDAGAPSGQATAVVNVASDVTNMIIETNGEPQFTRITSFGGDDFTRAVQEQTGVSFAEAELLKARIGMTPPSREEDETGGSSGEQTLTDGGSSTDEGSDEPGGGDEAGGGQQPAGDPGKEGIPPQGGDFLEGPQTGGPADNAAGPPSEGGGFPGGGPGEDSGFTPGAESGGGEGGGPGELDWPEVGGEDDEERERVTVVRRAIEITADSFAEELRRSLDYYMSQDDSLPIGKLILSGGGSLLPNLISYLSQIFPFPVELGDPLVRITQNKSDISDEELRALAPRLAIAIGLALEDEE